LLLVPRGAAAAEGRAKAAVPGEAEQEKALRTVRGAFPADFTEAAMADEDWMRKMLQRAESEKDPNLRYVLLTLVRDRAERAGDVEELFEAIGLLAESHRVNGVQMKLDCLLKVAKGSTSDARRARVAEGLFRLIDEALGEEQFDLATRIANFAHAAAMKVKDTDLAKEIVGRRKQIKENQEAFAEAAKAMQLLEQKPLDPEANAMLGRYRCLRQGNWGVGLPMLALGNDPKLGPLAIRELEGPSAALEQIELADQWWDLAEKEQGIARTSLLKQADAWYRKAVQGLGGPVKDRVEKRLKATGAELGIKGEFDPGKWADVLSLPDPKKHAVRGEWRRLGENIVCDAAPKSLLLVPLSPQGNYELKLKFRRVTGDTDVALVLPVGNQSCFILFTAAVAKLAADATRLSGLGLIDGKWEKDNPTVSSTFRLTNNQDYQLAVQVKRRGEFVSIGARLNGKALLGWTGRDKSLSVPEDFRLPQPALGLWGRDTSVHFTEMKLRVLSGELRRIEWEAPPPPPEPKTEKGEAKKTAAF
jgi:hypothetical protein